MEAVVGTALSAASSKMAAAQRGYFGDPFTSLFHAAPMARSSPIMNRGTYVRVAAYDAVCDAFSAAGKEGEQRQILSLGAGYDTRPLRMRHANTALDRYVEVDVPQVMDHKRHVLQAAASAHIGPHMRGSAAVPAPFPATEGWLHLVGADLRRIDGLRSALDACGLDPSAPTLVLLECVLVYLEPEESAGLLSFISSYLQDPACLVYDMVHPEDPFGAQMVANLRARGLRLAGLEACPSPAAHVAKLKATGWAMVEATSMLEWYEKALDAAERVRVERLEWLDEVEEWRLLLSHYMFALAVGAVGSTAHAGLHLLTRSGDGQRRREPQDGANAPA